MRRILSGNVAYYVGVLMLGLYLSPASIADKWGWDETVSAGDFTNPNNWLNLIKPPPPQHGVPQSGDSIVAFNTSMGAITIRCSGNSVSMATLDCNLDLSAGGLSISGTLAGGEGAVGTFAAGSSIFGNGTLSVNLLQDNLIVTQGATCNINTTVFPDGTGNATVSVTGANSAFNDTGDFQNSLTLNAHANASVGGTLRGALSLSNAASFAGNAVEGTVNVDSATFESTGAFKGDLTITNSGTATISGSAQGNFTLGSASTLTAAADVQGSVAAAGSQFNANTFGGRLSLVSGSAGAITTTAAPVGEVDGPGSKLTVGLILSVTNGDFNIRNGGAFSASSALIGPDLGGFNPDAILALDGANSQRVVKSLIQVGLASTSPGLSYLFVQDGATLTSQGLDLGVGNTGVVQVLQGGLFTSVNRAVVGRDTGSRGMVGISGPGALWKHVSADVTQPAVMVVGQSGLGQLTVSGGGLLQADALEIGVASLPGSSLTGVGQVTVQDASSILSVNELTVGTDKPAMPAVGEQPLGRGTLNVGNNGTVNVHPQQPGDPIVVLTSTQLPNSINVGPLGVLNASQSKLVLAGEGQALTITNGGYVKTGGGSIGNGNGPGSGMLLSPDGSAPSEWDLAGAQSISDPLVIGDTAEGTLNVGANSLVNVLIGQGNVRIGGAAPGTLAVAGQNAMGHAFTSGMVVGNAAMVGTLTVSQQGQVHVPNITLIALSDGVPTSLPSIQIAPAANGLLVAWPEFEQGYTLQATPSLSAPQWQDLMTLSNQWSVVPTNTMQFFRLTKP